MQSIKENQLSEGELMFIELCRSKNHSEVQAYINSQGEIYRIEASQLHFRKSNEVINPNKFLVRRGFKDVTFKMQEGRISHVVSKIKFRVNGVDATSNKEYI